MEQDTVRAGEQLKDDLKLQAWLARAELRNPSVHREVKALAQWRDDLRLQVALGKLEARDEWERVEGQWFKVRARLEEAMDDTSEELKGLLADIRTAYDRMTHH